MPTIQSKHWLALKSRIDTLVTDPALLVVEPGQVIEAPNNAPFLMVSDTRNQVSRLGIDTDLQERSGTLILSVRWPLQTPVTHAQLVEIGGTIAEHFPADLCMSFGGKSIRVIEDASMMQPDVDGAYRVVTVRALWSSIR